MSIEPSIVFDTYWRFAAERQAMFFRRQAGSAGPVTRDPILAMHRFTNAYRASDRVSQYLISDVQYGQGRSQAPRELFFRTVLFKLFNRIETWEAIERIIGPVEGERTDLDQTARVLDRLLDMGQRIYSAAYIMSSPPFGHDRKHRNHLALLVRMMADRVPDRVRQAPSLRAVYELLLRQRGLGPFLASQYAFDLNYSDLLDFDEADFVIAGPGALDGIAKCFHDTGGLSAEEIIFWTVDRQEREFARLGLSFAPLFGRRLQPIDCQNLYCEVSKYARLAHPEVAGVSGRRRIKQSYRPDPRPLATLMFPPRWGLDVAGVRSRRATVHSVLEFC